MQQLVWVAVIVGAVILFWLPVIAAVIRGTEPLRMVALLTMMTPFGGITWVGAWIAVFVLPRRLPAAPRLPALPPWDDPRTLYGGVLPEAPAGGSRRQAGAGVRAW